jgi:hypothetical protein
VKLRFSVAIAMAFGLVTLLGYFILQPRLLALRLLFTDWAAVLAAVALVMGLYNLLAVHWQRTGSQGNGWFYSSILIITLLITFGMALWQGPAGVVPSWIFNYIQVPVEGSLAALLSVVLLTAGFRLLRDSRRPKALTWVFLGTAIIVLLGTLPLTEGVGVLFAQAKIWISQVPVLAGARGILLGIVLGVVATGLRVLMGADRPYTD